MPEVLPATNMAKKQSESMKNNRLSELIKDALKDGKAVIVALQNTGEASDVRNIIPNAPEYVSTCEEIFKEVTTNAIIPDFGLDPIDAIIQEFGTDNVAEITGRKKRVDIVNGKLSYVAKPSTLKECINFQTGKKDRAEYRCGKISRIINPTETMCNIGSIVSDERVLLLGNSHADSIKVSFANAMGMQPLPVPISNTFNLSFKREKSESIQLTNSSVSGLGINTDSST